MSCGALLPAGGYHWPSPAKVWRIHPVPEAKSPTARIPHLDRTMEQGFETRGAAPPPQKGRRLRVTATQHPSMRLAISGPGN